MTQLPPRLSRTLLGHYHEMMAAYHRSAAHKLPGGKGVIREDAVANFIGTWLSKRNRPHTNVFASAIGGEQLGPELDLVVLDEFDGVAWPIDAGAVNAVVTWEQIRVVVEVKSTLTEHTLNKACEAMNEVAAFAERNGDPVPTRLLFAYQIDPDLKDDLLYQFEEQGSDSYPFDAFVILQCGVFCSSELNDLRWGFASGLAPEKVANDGPYQDKAALEFGEQTRFARGFRSMGDGSHEETLMALACIVTNAVTDGKSTQALLSALKRVEYFPIS
ncbi:DUF6602 domain-containing protein (plasmid) [Agrobacterium rosae]|uniref:DUF6602 domain-containing protein n=1 Tax=Agrobacterium rosae TaxID=1972867 RepID=A0AAW9FND8_9HYPH|nr:MULTISPECIES: DUF6602 domain-containing protein [Agrobacterium]MDX8321358.1 hypothetical protein [Agrobacterium sp. rho-8.1]MDX8305077.1 hypothetical protein [Agrobacterium rosae]MDX8310891.1 hypothetical protein [Agrobacterium sp. rho-13.3]MDX8327168.1 hypothetical protein [Agrobacterium tumefaciens]MDX8332608.1 hypothetical protein [Agrobacterium rosae]